MSSAAIDRAIRAFGEVDPEQWIDYDQTIAKAKYFQSLSRETQVAVFSGFERAIEKLRQIEANLAIEERRK